MVRVLVVDDDPLVLRAMESLIRRFASVVAVDSGAAALAELERDTFDAIITDLGMPVMDGLTLLGHVRERWPSLRRVLVSGSAVPAIDPRDPRVDLFLSKPVELSVLRDALGGDIR